MTIVALNVGPPRPRLAGGAGSWRLSATADQVADALAAMPPEHRAVIEPVLLPVIREELRRARRRAAVSMAAQLLGDGTNRQDPWPLCGRLHEALAEYANGRWRFERGGPAPTDRARVGLHAVLTETRGVPLSQRQLYRLLLTDNSGPGNVSGCHEIELPSEEA